jgi:hypothetical protein
MTAIPGVNRKEAASRRKINLLQNKITSAARRFFPINIPSQCHSERSEESHDAVYQLIKDFYHFAIIEFEM